MCSDTKEYPLKLSGYSRVQIPCTSVHAPQNPMYPRVHDCGEAKALRPPLKGSLFYRTLLWHTREYQYFNIQSKLPTVLEVGCLKL